MIDPKLTVRPVEPADYPALADLTNAVYRSLGDDRIATVQEMELEFSSPELDVANDSFIVERTGEIVGMAGLMGAGR